MMGDKISAKQAMRAADVPTVPGTEGATTVDDARARPPTRSAIPILLKATRGRRRQGHAARRSAPTSSRTRSARRRPRPRRRSATRRLYVEKALVPARHVEIQVLCDDARQRADARRARVLDPAPPPEADRGVAVGRADARDARGDGGGGRARVPRGRLPQRRHVRVPARPRRQLLLHRAERAAPGRASGDRAVHRASTSCASSCASPPASRSRSPAARRGAGTRSRSA